MVHIPHEENVGTQTSFPSPVTPPSPITAVLEGIFCLHDVAHSICLRIKSLLCVLGALLCFRLILCDYKAGTACLAIHNWWTDVWLFPWGYKTLSLRPTSGELGASKSRNGETKQATPTKLQVLRKHIKACLVSLVLWLSPSIGSVSEVRLMFPVCFLLWQLLSYVVLVIELLADWWHL